jgi:uncharacterized protein YigA (DUF484 family)
MTGKHKDSAAGRRDIPRGDKEGLNGGEVMDYLGRHPDFLTAHPELLEALSMPARWSGDGVVDIQQFMLERLRGEIDSLRGCAQDVIETSRTNMSTQTRVHAAVLALLATNNFDHLLRTIAEDLPLLLDVDVVTICFESGAMVEAKLVSPPIRRLEAGQVDCILGPDRDLALFREMDDDGTIFGGGSSLVRSAALSRLRPGAKTPDGLLALGSRGNAFHPGQATDLITFLGRVIERCIHRFLARQTEQT